MERIVIKLHAVNWTEGEIAYFWITLLSDGGGVLTVDWGDGHVSRYQSHRKGECLHPEHDYGKKARHGEQPFVVVIESHNVTIETFNSGCGDMWIDDIDFSSSPSIETLDSVWHGNIDLTPIVGLKHLTCQDSPRVVMDFSKNINLETLDCCYSKVQSILLSQCNNLKEIDCSYCPDLQIITLSNDSQLKKITLSHDHNIKPKSWEYIQKIIEKNNGRIEFA